MILPVSDPISSPRAFNSNLEGVNSPMSLQTASDQTKPYALTMAEVSQDEASEPAFYCTESTENESTASTVDFVPLFDDPLY